MKKEYFNMTLPFKDKEFKIKVRTIAARFNLTQAGFLREAVNYYIEKIEEGEIKPNDTRRRNQTTHHPSG